LSDINPLCYQQHSEQPGILAEPQERHTIFIKPTFRQIDSIKSAGPNSRALLHEKQKDPKGGPFDLSQPFYFLMLEPLDYIPEILKLFRYTFFLVNVIQQCFAIDNIVNGIVPKCSLLTVPPNL
jgi:hypothetical protein